MSHPAYFLCPSMGKSIPKVFNLVSEKSSQGLPFVEMTTFMHTYQIIKEKLSTNANP